MWNAPEHVQYENQQPSDEGAQTCTQAATHIYRRRHSTNTKHRFTCRVEWGNPGVVETACFGVQVRNQRIAEDHCIPHLLKVREHPDPAFAVVAVCPQDRRYCTKLNPSQKQFCTRRVCWVGTPWRPIARVKSPNVVAPIPPHLVCSRLRGLDLPVESSFVLKRIPAKAVGVPVVACQ